MHPFSDKIMKSSSTAKDETDSTEEEQTEEDFTIKIAAIQESIGSEEQLTRAQGYQTMLEKVFGLGDGGTADR